MFRMHAVRALAALALASLAAPPARAASPASDSLFAPLVAWHAEREARAARVPNTGAVRASDAIALVEAGLPDRAAGVLVRIQDLPEAVAEARLRVALARHDWDAARPLAKALLADRSPTEAERALRNAWLFATDDMATLDRLVGGPALPGPAAPLPDVVAAGRLAVSLLRWERAESCFTQALARATPPYGEDVRVARTEALRGMGLVLAHRRDYDGSLARLRAALELRATPELLGALSETLVRLGRTDDAISAAEWAVRISPYSDAAHYWLGNGYARKSYTELFAAYPRAFANAAGRLALARADSLLARGDRMGARTAYAAVREAHPGWADAAIRLASLEFEDGHYDRSRDLCFEALRACPEYGRAHATLAKALEFRRFAIDVHRAEYERRFAAAPIPSVPGIETFVVNWKSLSARDRKRVALSMAPWKQFVPVLVAGGSSYYIKPLYMLLSETPGLETLRDTRISYDSRLWDDVRGAGGYCTVTGIEDVERTVFDRYNTVLHEFTHQVHGVLTADQSREIQELYRKAKARDDVSHDAYLSRYAGGSVYEYFAEGANALMSPKRDAYDPRDVVKERMDERDPDLAAIVKRFMALTDVSASYPVAFTNAGDDRVSQGKVDEAIAFYEKALARAPREETALGSLARARILQGDRSGALAAAANALAAHPASGSIVSTAAEARRYGGAGIDSALALALGARAGVKREDLYQVDSEIGGLWWAKGDAPRALAAYDSVLAYQSDNPSALWGKAAALALARDWTPAFEWYDKAVRMRTGIAALRCDYARDLLRAGRVDAARTQLDEAKLLDPQNPRAEAYRGWAQLAAGHADSAKATAARALAWGDWCDEARIVLGMAEAQLGDRVAADAAWQPLRARIANNEPPGYVFRTSLSEWVSVHELPAVDRELIGAAEPAAGATKTRGDAGRR